MSGALSVPAAAVGVFSSNGYAQVAFVITAFICVWFAAYSVWRVEREARIKAENKTTAIRGQLDYYYVELEGMIKNHISDDYRFHSWVTSAADWIEINIGKAGRARFLQSTRVDSFYNERVSVNTLKQIRDNLRSMIEGGSY